MSAAKQLASTISLPLSRLAGIGFFLLSQHLFLRLISEQFLYEMNVTHSPVIAFVVSQISAGFVFLCLLLVLPTLKTTRTTLILIFFIGLLLRLMLFGTNPIMEIDFYRYLWDGAVLAQGHNPYLFAPNTAALANHGFLLGLSEYAGAFFDRINYSDLRTIYPPLSQIFFALAYFIDGWNLDSWRLLLLLSEIVSFGLILKILVELHKSTLWVSLYWWNPLVTKEIFNSAHMDVLLIPFLLAAILMLIRKRQVFAGAYLTMAAGIKLWPLLILPFCLRPLLACPKRLIMAILIIFLLATVFIAPLLLYGSGNHSGLANFSLQWLRNSGLFQLLQSTLVMFFDSGNAIARILTGFFLIAIVFIFNRTIHSDPSRIIQLICWTIAILFFLSPAIFPWYFTWFAPLLCFYPNRALLLLTALMPIYYLRFYLAARGNAEMFDQYIVWIQYIPVFLLLMIDYFKIRLIPSLSKRPTW